MPVAPVIAKKLKAGDSAKAIGMELDRRAHTYVNDVDLSKSSENVDIATRPGDASPLPLDEAIDRRLGELHVKRKIRKDAVRAVGFIVSSNAALPDDEARGFLSAAVDWFGDRYGRENLLAASIHMDEGTPHAHLWVCPVVHDEATGYDRLSAKTLFTPDRRVKQADGTWEVTGEGTMTKLQTDFWRDVASRWGFERPLTREQRGMGYRSLAAYKTGEGATREAQTRAAEAREEAEAARGDLAEVNGQLDAARAALAAAEAARARAEKAEAEAEEEARASRSLAAVEAERLEGLQRVNEEIAPVAGELEQAAGLAERATARGRPGERSVVSGVAECLGRAVSHLRAAVGGGGALSGALGRCLAAFEGIRKTLRRAARGTARPMPPPALVGRGCGCTGPLVLDASLFERRISPRDGRAYFEVTLPEDTFTRDGRDLSGARLAVPANLVVPFDPDFALWLPKRRSDGGPCMVRCRRYRELRGAELDWARVMDSRDVFEVEPKVDDRTGEVVEGAKTFKVERIEVPAEKLVEARRDSIERHEARAAEQRRRDAAARGHEPGARDRRPRGHRQQGRSR